MESEPSSLTNELLDMAEKDRAMRDHGQRTGEWDVTVDQRHTLRLKEIVASNGWPSCSMVGEAAASAAWVLVQHADLDPEFQAKCLEHMKRLPEDEVARKDLAYLEDRVRVNTDKPQLYGTQFYREDGVFKPRPIEDEANLDKRRRAAGLNSFADYKKEIEAMDKRYQKVVTSKQTDR